MVCKVCQGWSVCSARGGVYALPGGGLYGLPGWRVRSVGRWSVMSARGCSIKRF